MRVKIEAYDVERNRVIYMYVIGTSFKKALDFMLSGLPPSIEKKIHQVILSNADNDA